MLSINLLGSPLVTLDGMPLRGFVSGKAVGLLYYLAATGKPHTRETLAGLFWPDANNTQALKNLRDILSNLRHLLEPHLEITRQAVALNAADLRVDSRVFVEVCAAAEREIAADDVVARLREALDMYQGDFLAGFSLPDASEFESWALIERERLRQLMLSILQQLAIHAGHQADYPGGIRYASQLLALDPLNEAAHRQLMLLLAMNGQRSAALAQYASFRRRLNDELGIDQDEASEALYRQILDGEIAGAQQPATTWPIYQLPAPLNTVIGRDSESAQISARLAEPTCRLVTITGPGGVGKTCLALHAAQQLAATSQRGEAFIHGIVFVGLVNVDASSSEPQAIATKLAARIATALRFSFAGPEEPQHQLANFLKDRDLLLVLDNCEHLPVAEFVLLLLEQAAPLKIMLTSRGRLNLRGEHILELEGLAFPAEAGEPQATEAYSALQLFRQTAQAANPRLTWTPATVAAAGRICRLVGGLPLAIELAASLTRLMPIGELAGELSASLEFLQSTAPALPDRHRSLRAVFDHSWKLLRPNEQRALQQLAVFRGGFSRDAAARVADAPLALLSTLIDNSLVRQQSNPERGAGRYELLELVRQYAAEHLRQTSEQQALPTPFERHARYYLEIVIRLADELRGRRQQAAAETLAGEIENIRAAWHWAVAEGQADLVGSAAESLFFFFEMHSWFREGAETFGQAAARFSREPGAQLVSGKLLARQGWCTFQIGQQAEATILLRQSITVLRPLQAPVELVLPLNYLAAISYYSGDYATAEQLVDEALAISRACGDRHGEAVALTIVGQIAALVGRYDAARDYSEASLAIERELGNRWGMVFPLISLGRVAQALTAYQEAQRYFEEGLVIRQAFGDTRGVALCLQYLGDIAEALADYGQAGWRYREALDLLQAIGNQAGVVATLTKLGDNALALGERERADNYFRESLRIAWQTRSVPQLLRVLVSIAAALAESDPPQALRLAIVAREHPAATQESRDRANALLGQLGADDRSVPANATTDDELAAIVRALQAN